MSRSLPSSTLLKDMHPSFIPSADSTSATARDWWRRTSGKPFPTPKYS